MFRIFITFFLFCSVLKAGVFFEPVAGNDKIYRGRAPKPGEYSRLVNGGVTTVIILKNQLKSEVNDEIRQLREAGIARKNIHHIPLKWKDLTSQVEACEQLVEAMNILVEVDASNSERAFFHCSVGEDRTGLLAGLITELLGRATMKTAYVEQMCQKGYADGNPHKPKDVSDAVMLNLTPLYFKISALIKSGRLNPNSLDKAVCRDIEKIKYTNQIKPCSEITK